MLQLIGIAAVADESGEPKQAVRHLIQAARVLGTRDADLVLLVPRLLKVDADLRAPADHGLDDALQLAGTVRAALSAADVHPTMAQDLWAVLASITYRVARERGDTGLLERGVDDVLTALNVNSGATQANARTCLINAATMLSALYDETSSAEYLYRSLEMRERAMSITSETDPARVKVLHDLAASLGDLYSATNDRDALLRSIAVAREGIACAADDEAPVAAHLRQLLSAQLGALYDATGDEAVLRESVEIATRGVELASADDDVARALGSLAYRSSDLYHRTGSRADLERALDAAEGAVSASRTNRDRASAADVLAFRLEDRYRLTDDLRDLDRAVDASEEAILLTLPGARSLANYLTNGSNHYRVRYGATNAVTDLERAVELAERAVGLVTAHDVGYALLLANLASAKMAMFRERGEVSTLVESIELSRAARGLSSAGSPDAVSNSINMASAYLDLFRATGDDDAVVAAEELVDSIDEASPREVLSVSALRAEVADLRGRPAAAAAARERAIAAFDDEVERLAGQPLKLRDLAGETEGMLGALTMSYVRDGDVGAARRTLERNRLWARTAVADVAAPGLDRLTAPGALGWTTVWVAAGSDETVVLCDDLPDGHARLAVSRSQIFAAVARMLDSFDETEASIYEAADGLVDLTSTITRAFPRADHLLIVPLGITALLAFAAGRTSEDSDLIRASTVSMAPTLASALRLDADRPANADALGVFVAGEGVAELDLASDRAQFRESFPGSVVLDEGCTAAEVLAAQGRASFLTHLSCHGSYNLADPLSSRLEVGDDLLLSDVLQRGVASWLMNLSACETGVPDISRSEQMISFATAFYMAGAAHVIGASWPIENTHATRFSQRFYRELTAGGHPAVAHRAAVLELRGTDDDPTAERSNGVMAHPAPVGAVRPLRLSTTNESTHDRPSAGVLR